MGPHETSRRQLLSGLFGWLWAGMALLATLLPKSAPSAGSLPGQFITSTTYRFDAEGNCVGVEQEPPYAAKLPARVYESGERFTIYTYYS